MVRILHGGVGWPARASQRAIPPVPLLRKCAATNLELPVGLPLVGDGAETWPAPSRYSAACTRFAWESRSADPGRLLELTDGFGVALDARAAAPEYGMSGVREPA